MLHAVRIEWNRKKEERNGKKGKVVSDVQLKQGCRLAKTGPGRTKHDTAVARKSIASNASTGKTGTQGYTPPINFFYLLCQHHVFGCMLTLFRAKFA